jgi:hypothetical protein
MCLHVCKQKKKDRLSTLTAYFLLFGFKGKRVTIYNHRTKWEIIDIAIIIAVIIAIVVINVVFDRVTFCSSSFVMLVIYTIIF